MTGSHKCVPVRRMGNIMTVQTESRLWCLYFFLYIYWFFLKNCGVEHGFDALMESGELSNMPQVWIKEKKIASSTFMLKKNKTKISPLWCLIYNMLSVWDLCVAFVELAESSQLRKIAQGWTILWVTFEEKIKKKKKEEGSRRTGWLSRTTCPWSVLTHRE